MNHTKQIDKLWQQFRQAINQAYKSNAGAGGDASWNTNALRDYTEDGWHDDLAKLLAAEVKNERQHRRGENRAPISAYAASKLLLMGNAVDGANKFEMIPASHFLVYRKTAMEAEVIGWIAREFLSQEWRSQVKALDYAKIMRGEQ